ncbi:MAG: RNA methyltransferase, partial [Planctomycetaceae bacterium]|nr:RNA methyltransferase [Planctomycetaceae bacterium]
RLPVLESSNLRQELTHLRSTHGFSLAATVLSDHAEPLDQVQPPPRNIILFGNEGEGLSTDWIDLCDRHITIPMRSGTDSLNVAVAAGIFLYHFDPHR